LSGLPGGRPDDRAGGRAERGTHGSIGRGIVRRGNALRSNDVLRIVLAGSAIVLELLQALLGSRQDHDRRRGGDGDAPAEYDDRGERQQQ
jgi:hypothetical protein